MKPRKGGPRLVLAALASIVAVLSVTSCSSGGSEDDARNASAQPVEENQQLWAMPLDEFAVASIELGNYAEQLLMGECLTDKGYQWTVPWQNAEFPPPPNFNNIGIKLFNVDTAQKWGYRIAPAADPVASEKWVAFTRFADSYNPDASFEGEFLSCLQSVRDPDTMSDAEQFDYIMGLKFQASDVASTEPAVRKAAEEWRRCIAGQFGFEPPDVPQEMPTPSLEEQFELSGSTQVAAAAEEISVAVADAKCQESSGYASARYQAEWDAEVELMNENRDKLERIRSEALTHRKKLLSVVAENAPQP